MWIKRQQFVALLTDGERAMARVQALEGQLRFLTEQFDSLKAEKAEIYDDLRRLLGLKPRVIVQSAPQGEATGDAPPQNQQFKMKETPRETLMRLQAKHDQAAKEEDVRAIRAAIDEYEEVLK